MIIIFEAFKKQISRLYSRPIKLESLEGRVIQSISTVRKHPWWHKRAVESHCSRIYKVIGAAMILTFKEGSNNLCCTHSSHLVRKSYLEHWKKASSMWGIIYVINSSNISINNYGFPYKNQKGKFLRVDLQEAVLYC